MKHERAPGGRIEGAGDVHALPGRRAHREPGLLGRADGEVVSGPGAERQRLHRARVRRGRVVRAGGAVGDLHAQAVERRRIVAAGADEVGAGRADQAQDRERLLVEDALRVAKLQVERAERVGVGDHLHGVAGEQRQAEPVLLGAAERERGVAAGSRRGRVRRIAVRVHPVGQARAGHTLSSSRLAALVGGAALVAGAGVARKLAGLGRAIAGLRHLAVAAGRAAGGSAADAGGGVAGEAGTAGGVGRALDAAPAAAGDERAAHLRRGVGVAAGLAQAGAGVADLAGRAGRAGEAAESCSQTKVRWLQRWPTLQSRLLPQICTAQVWLPTVRGWSGLRQRPCTQKAPTLQSACAAHSSPQQARSVQRRWTGSHNSVMRHWFDFVQPTHLPPSQSWPPARPPRQSSRTSHSGGGAAGLPLRQAAQASSASSSARFTASPPRSAR